MPHSSNYMSSLVGYSHMLSAKRQNKIRSLHKLQQLRVWGVRDLQTSPGACSICCLSVLIHHRCLHLNHIFNRIFAPVFICLGFHSRIFTILHSLAYERCIDLSIQESQVLWGRILNKGAYLIQLFCLQTQHKCLLKQHPNMFELPVSASV